MPNLMLHGITKVNEYIYIYVWPLVSWGNPPTARIKVTIVATMPKPSTVLKHKGQYPNLCMV